LILASVTQGFTRPDAGWPLTGQLAVLCALYIGICAVVYLPLGLAADRVLGARPAVAHVTTRIAGVSMVLVGAFMVAERVIHALHG
jgi:threonine/homoserine/homoserine lactone efflux protein